MCLSFNQVTEKSHTRVRGTSNSEDGPRWESSHMNCINRWYHGLKLCSLIFPQSLECPFEERGGILSDRAGM